MAKTWKKSSKHSSSNSDSSILLTIGMMWDSDTFLMQTLDMQLLCLDEIYMEMSHV